MMNTVQTAKKPTISSSFYDSYTEKPVKWYEIVDAYRQYSETYLPLRLENYPREMWENFKKVFKVSEPEEIEDDPVNEVERTRADGNIIKVTEYDLAKDNYDTRISEAVRTHKEKGKFSDRQSSRPRQSNTATSAYPVPVRNTSASTITTRRPRYTNRVSPVYDDCPECRALAAAAAAGGKGYPTMCNCDECRAKRGANPNIAPYCDCSICRNTKRA